MNIKKILGSVFTIGIILVVAVFATNAFFSDTETSTGNLFVAGDIDLRISNESYATDCTIPGFGECTGELVASQSNTWQASDLTNQLFFNFTDLKPGDFGEDTIDIVVGSNDAWACMAVDMTATPENEIVDPEADAGDETDGEDGGELQDYLEFAFWVDDGDNVFENDEEVAWTGRANEMFDGTWQRLADSTGGFFGEETLPGDETVYVAKAWCFGELTQNPVESDEGDQGQTPLTAGTGFTCNGAGDGDQNDAQTDSIEADISFYAVQARNNDDFLCSSLPPFVGGDGDDEERPEVGAALGDYTQAASCDVTVTDAESIQDAIDDSDTVDGETVCVEDGTYDEDVLVNKEIRLSGAGAVATSIINGQGAGEAGALVIAANNVIVEGFLVNGSGVSAIRISGARDNVTVRNNKAVAATGNNAFLTDGGQSNHSIMHNVFEGDASQLAYVNGTASVALASTNVDFTYNTFGGTASGPLLGMEATGSVVTNNIFSGTTGFTSLESWASDLLVNINNFNVVDQTHVTNSAGGTLNAEDNWWGDGDPSNNVSAGVDFDPFAASPYPEN